MIIVAAILAAGYVPLVYILVRALMKTQQSHMIREWELQERIREPEVEVMPPDLIIAQAQKQVKSDPSETFEQEEISKDQFDLVGQIFNDGVPGEDD